MKIQTTRTRLFASTMICGLALFGGQAFAQGGGTPQGAANDCPADSTKPCASTPAQTQSVQTTGGGAGAAAGEGELVVTGSHIPRARFETLQPAEILTSQTIQDRGVTNVADLLNELPAFGVPGSQNRGGQSAVNVGSNFVDLYGLGSQRTLTLVNGRRFVSSNPPTALSGAAAGLQVDLNNIAAGLVDHVEVVSVGGAPTYGADAVAGVVNIILKDNFEGLQAEASYGFDQYKGAGKSYQARFLAGANFAGDKGNITISAEYDQEDRINFSDSKYLSTHSFTAVSSSQCTAQGYDNCLINNVRVPSISYGGVPSSPFFPLANYPSGGTYPFAILNSNNQPVAFAPDGSLQPFDFGTQSDSTAVGDHIFSSGGDGVDLNALTTLQSPIKRRLLNFFAHYDFTPHVRAYVEAYYSNSSAVQPNNQPTYQSLLFAASGPGQSDTSDVLFFSVNNPFLTPQARAILLANPDVAATGTFALSRANIDLAPQDERNEVNVYRFVGGLKGDVDVLGRKINWDGSFNYGRSEAYAQQYDIWDEAFENAIDAVVDPATGNIVCNVTLNPPPPAAGGRVDTAVSGCVPLNLFGQGNQSQAARDFVTKAINQSTLLTQRDIQLNANSSVFDEWAGPVKLALGFEYRQETGDFQVDGFTEAGLGRSSAVTPLSGDFSSTEFYAETTVPLVSPEMGVPFIHAAQFEGSYRRIDNSIEGAANVFTLGGRFSPVEDIEFRGNLTHSVRAPAIEELFLPTSQTFSFANDPCDVAHITEKANYAANCATAFAALPGANLSTFASNIENASQPGFVGGNPNLKNEVAVSWTAGAVMHPRWVPGLTFSADWIDIHLKNPITQLSLSEVLDACYSSSNYPNATYQGFNYCNAFTRLPNGQIGTYNTPTLNIGSRGFAGLQLEGAYRFNVASLPFMSPKMRGEDLGSITLDLSSLFTNNAYINALGTSDSRTNIRGDFGTPKWKVNASVRYTKGPFHLYVDGRYQSGQDFDVTSARTALNIYGVGSYIVFDGNVSYDISDQLTASVTVNNLLNKQPPYYAAYSANAIAQYDPYGRAFVFTLRARY